ncbi:MAG: hypothetical protein WC967_07545 [Balneolaceae bacterium]
MKVGIVGDASRAVAWEKHLRPHNIVTEVDLCATLREVGQVDACLILDDGPDNLDVLLEGIRHGLNCFLIAKQPTDVVKLDRIHRAAREAGVLVQFSHWPTLAPATQWMMDEMPKANFIHITRQLGRPQSGHPKEEFRNLWIDELGLCLKWMDSGVHHVEAKLMQLNENNPISIHIFLRFDNGSTASIFVYTTAEENLHHRVICNRTHVLDCDVPTQTIRIGRLSDGNHLFFSKQSFDPAKSAEKSALLFLKSIQLKSDTAYTSYDVLNLAQNVAKIEQRLAQFS